MNYCAMLYGLAFVLLCLCVLSLNVIMRFVCDSLRDDVCGVCVIPCGIFVGTVCAFCSYFIATLYGV